jgi:rare lipoprotein A (peptidoglycan hydrolase)
MFKLIALVHIILNSHSIAPKASCYNSNFEDKVTCSGETYNGYQLTAASPYMEFNTYVKIINPNNDSCVIVKINDRGPYKVDSTGKHMDTPKYHFMLSDSAYNSLGGTGKENIKIKYKLLEPNEVLEILEENEYGNN